MNVLKVVFSFNTIIIVIAGIIVNWFDKYSPALILKIYKYGKFSYEGTVPYTIQVPKRWFRHFYIVAAVLSATGVFCLVAIYFKLVSGLPPSIKTILSTVGTQMDTVPATRSLLAMILLMIHCARRFYETHFISVFSDSKMDMGHYFVGHIHYIGLVLSILCESPGTITDKPYEVSLSDLGVMTILAGLLFLWACHKQLSCAEILANLRKNDKGKIITTEHKIPHGSYFELVSSPHSLFEVIIYLSLWVILKESTTFPYIVVWVVANQIEISLLNHWWYKQTFKNYPQRRKAIIPFIL